VRCSYLEIYNEEVKVGSTDLSSYIVAPSVVTMTMATVCAFQQRDI
jgi:hypothetical protein